jgi:RNA recognition motif-containing protein
MNKKLFVGRLPFGFSNEQLRSLFIKSGTVVSAVMVPDAKSGKTRGFGFVDMNTEAEAQAAIQSLNGTSLEDKKIWVTLAREKGEAKPAAAFPKSGRRPFGDRPSFSNDRSGLPRFGSKPGFGPKKHSSGHFTDGANGAPSAGRSSRPATGRPSFGDRKPPFRGKRSFSGGDARPSSAPTGERRPFRSAGARPGEFHGPPKRAGGKRPPPRS